MGKLSLFIICDSIGHQHHAIINKKNINTNLETIKNQTTYNYQTNSSAKIKLLLLVDSKLMYCQKFYFDYIFNILFLTGISIIDKYTIQKNIFLFEENIIFFYNPLMHEVKSSLYL